MAMLLGSLSAARTQAAAFVNLDFESATVVPQNPNFAFLDWNLAVPGWQNSTGSDLGIVYHGYTHVGVTGWYMLYDQQSPVFQPNTQLAGNYSVGFANGAESSTEPLRFQQNFLSQTGDIAADVKSVRMLARGGLSVFVNGVAIPMQSLGGNAYGGDISMYAGTTAELKIVNTSIYNHDPLVIDNITFSPIAVPEPLSIAGAVAAVMGAARRRPHR